MRLHVVTGKGGTGKTTVAAALALALAADGRRSCSSRSRAGRASPSCSTRRRCPTRSARSPWPAAAGRSTRWRSTPRRRCSSTSTCSTTSPGRPGAAEDGRHRLRDDDRARPPRRPAHRQDQGGRRAAGTTAGRSTTPWSLDAPPTGRITRFLNVTGEMAELRRSARSRPRATASWRCSAPADRRAPRDAARGDAGAGDGRRHRGALGRAPAGRRGGRQHGRASRLLPAATSTGPRRAALDRAELAPALDAAGLDRRRARDALAERPSSTRTWASQERGRGSSPSSGGRP